MYPFEYCRALGIEMFFSLKVSKLTSYVFPAKKSYPNHFTCKCIVSLFKPDTNVYIIVFRAYFDVIVDK